MALGTAASGEETYGWKAKKTPEGNVVWTTASERKAEETAVQQVSDQKPLFQTVSKEQLMKTGTVVIKPKPIGQKEIATAVAAGQLAAESERIKKENPTLNIFGREFRIPQPAREGVKETGIGGSLLKYGAGGAWMIMTAAANPKETAVGIAEFNAKAALGMINPAYGQKFGGEQVKSLATSLETAPEFTAGALTGQYFIFKGLGIAGEKVLPKISYETIKVTTKAGEKEVSVFGFEKGTRSIAIASKTPEGFRLGLPKMKEALIPTEPMIAPASALGGKALRSATGLSDIQSARQLSALEVSKAGFGEKGLKVKPGELEFPIADLTKTQRTKLVGIVERMNEEVGGVIFGSATQKQLPGSYRKITIGDIDIAAIEKTEAELIKILPKYAKEVRNKIGIDVRISPRNPMIIEFAKSGEKLIELKAGVGPFKYSGESAEAGYLGLRFGDLRAGVTSDTVPFGKTRAIRIGEQLARKGSGVSFIVNTKEGLKVLPKPGRMKDLPTFVMTAKGIGALKESRWSPFEQMRTRKIESGLGKFLSTFPKEERMQINMGIKELYRKGAKIPIDISITPASKATSKGISPSSIIKIGSSSISLKPSLSPKSTKSPSISLSAFKSPSISISPKISPSLSPSLSPRKSPSPSTSPSISPKISIYPSFSPSKSPSPSLYSSPSPSPPSKTTIISPGLTIFPEKTMRLFKPKRIKKSRRLTRYEPSIVGIFERKTKWKPLKASIGIEVRPVRLSRRRR